MRRAIIGFLALIVIFYSSPGSRACTIFKVTRDNLTLVGNNEDDNNPDTKAWFLAAEEGRHGRVFFGYNDSIPQGGMNDQGLFFDWVADNPSPDWVRNPKKLNYPGSLCEKILEEASTLEEALAFYEHYNETAFLKSHLMLTDNTGDSAILGWKNGTLEIARSQSGFQGLGYGFGTAKERVQALDQLSVAAMGSIVEACLQTGEYPTQYSNVYDLRHGIVYVYLFHPQRRVIRINLLEELKKGNHYYNIPLMTGQMKRPPLTDHKTQKAVPLKPTQAQAMAGRFLIQPDYVLEISFENGKFYVQAPDVSRTEIYAGSPDRLFIRSLESSLLFKSLKNGKFDEVTLKLLTRESAAKRIG
jgi:hypothetical protein